MANRLPEKLTSMRKQLGLSQGDVAAKMNIPVTEYMHWENGTSIPSIHTLKRLADVFGIHVVMLVDNTVEVVLPPVSTESVEIPFITPPSEETKTVNVNTLSDLGSTKVMDTMGFDSTVANQIVEDDAPMEKTQSRPVIRPAKPTKEQKKKTTAIIVAVAAGALALVLGLIFLLRGAGGSSVALSGVNRLALGDTYSLYIKKSGELQMYGQFKDKNLFDGTVQVSAYDSHAAGLKPDGTVVTNGDDTEISDWKNIVQIAAGRTHTVALNDDGEVLCTGSDTGCQVSGWANINSLYAGNAVTIGLSTDGTVHASGADAVNGIGGIKSVAIGDSQILLISTSGTVKSYSLTDAAAADVSSWTDIDEAAVGSNFVAGMTSKGKVLIVTEDEDMKKAVEQWSDIRYIAAHGTTLVAVDRSGNMFGVGDNSHGQYVNSSSGKDKDDTEKKQLDMVKDINFSETTANIQIKWKAVTNADYYEVKFEPALATEIPQTSSTSVSIPASELNDGDTYQVTITAHSNKTDKYETSEPATVSYTFKSRTITLDTPSNVRAESTAENWIVRWDPVENASYYMISLNGGEEYRTEQNAFFYERTGFNDQSIHTVSIKACSESSSYSESVPAQVELMYELPAFSVTLNFTSNDGASFETRVIVVKQGIHTIQEMATADLIPAGYTLANPDRTVEINSDYSVEVVLQSSGSGEPEGGE